MMITARRNIGAASQFRCFSQGREECEICRLSPQEFPNEFLITKFGFEVGKNVVIVDLSFSPKEFPIEYLIAKFSYDTAENGPFKV